MQHTVKYHLIKKNIWPFKCICRLKKVCAVMLFNSWYNRHYCFENQTKIQINVSQCVWSNLGILTKWKQSWVLVNLWFNFILKKKKIKSCLMKSCNRQFDEPQTFKHIVKVKKYIFCCSLQMRLQESQTNMVQLRLSCMGTKVWHLMEVKGVMGAAGCYSPSSCQSGG